MKKVLLIGLSLIFLTGCNKNENGNSEQLKEKFHGKYEVISSIATDAVDLNMDGITSTDLLSENSEISKSALEIRISGTGNNLFEEKWPVETIVVPRDEVFDSTAYHPEYSVYYALYCSSGTFRFSDDYKRLQLTGAFQPDSPDTLLSLESITIEENETIKVITIRKLYTKNGWIRTKIESNYKRYTTTT